MKKNNISALLILLVFLMILAGCGTKSGAPGSDSQGTGIRLASISIIGEEPAGGDNEIDTALHLCPPDFTELEEGLFIANAEITINAVAIGFDSFPASVEECTVTYLRGNDNPDAPLIESLTTYPNCTIEEGENTCLVVMMDVDRKRQFWNDLNDFSFSVIRPVHYVARFECEYVNRYDSGNFQVEYDIWLDDWDYC